MKFAKSKIIPLAEVEEDRKNSSETAFTSWMSKSENLKELGEILGIEIEDIDAKTQGYVGKYKFDILAFEANTGSKILIENQYNKTNHDHLGKIITYASGVDAKYIIWTTEEVNDEHKSAIDWLNKFTDEEISFYLVKTNAIKTGDYEPSLKYEVVCKPNEFQKEIKQEIATAEESNSFYPHFFESFRAYVKDQKDFKEIVNQKPSRGHWYSITVGASGVKISLTASKLRKEIACELYITENKELFDFLYKNKTDIENKLNYELDWQRLKDETKASRIEIVKNIPEKHFANLPTFENNKEVYDWYYEKTLDFKKVFIPYLEEYFKK
jgi:hypothetical protein